MGFEVYANIEGGSVKEYICIPKEEYVKLLKTFNDLESIIKALRSYQGKQKLSLIDIEKEAKS